MSSRQILSTFPFKEIELSYETPVHKKVHGSHITIAIPDGIKSYAWFEKQSGGCWILEITNGSVSNITRLTQEFNPVLKGTILYGTTFRCKSGNLSFSIEDVLFFKGKNVCRMNLLHKFNLLNDVFKQSYLVNPEIAFGLPFMDKQFYALLNAIPTLQYKSSNIHFRYLEGKMTNTAFVMKYIKPRVKNQLNTTATTATVKKGVSVFSVVADIQPDVYYLTAPDGTTCVACIPNYTVSVMMNTLFRNIKENNNLDALEESDDEEDFEDVRIEKYLIPNETPIKMKCEYNYKFKKWTPVSVVFV